MSNADCVYVHNMRLLYYAATCHNTKCLLLLQIHLIYDLQLMMAGKRVQVSPDDYIQSALSIFLDVINIFLMILTFLGASGLGNN